MILGLTLLELGIIFVLFIAGFIFAAKELFPLFLVELFVIIPALAYYLQNINLYALAFANPLYGLFGIIAFVAIGILYSFYKWYRFTTSEEMQTRIKLAYKDWSNSDDSFKNKYPFEIYSLNPIARSGFSLSNENNYRIAHWIFTWPLGIIWNVIDDLVLNLAKTIFKVFGSIYDKISNSAYKQLK